LIMTGKTHLFKSTVWASAGFAVSQLLRLASNLVLTRLLFPEVFGLMALVQVVMVGVKMFSDMGIATSVLRDKAGDDPVYLDTAWTMQVIRGVIVWFICLALAYPASLFYDSPELVFLLPVVGLGAICQGFNSTSILSLKRKIELRTVVLWELLVQLTTVIVTVYLAWQLKSVWALAIGSLIGAAVGTLSSYSLKLARRPKFHLDREVFGNIFHFGKWIFLSTALTYVVQQGDVLILGSLLSIDTLGLYAIAVIWSRLMLQLLLKINDQVLLPLYARFYHEDRETVRGKIFRNRTVILAVAIPATCILVLGGQFLVDLLYDQRYQGVGWMLQILSIGTIGSIIAASSGNALLSFGDSLSFMKFQIARSLLLVLSMLIGGILYGTFGIVVGVAVSKFIAYPVLAFYLHRHGIWMPKLDLSALVAAFGIIAIPMWIASPGLFWGFL
jgi:O-antigen/teichoic acid export membrane protein